MSRSAPAKITGGNGHAVGGVLDAPGRPASAPASSESPSAARRRSPIVIRRRAGPAVSRTGPSSDYRPSLVMLAALGFVLLLALLIRVAAVRQLSPQVDEPASILAAHQVAERGLPVLPSGTLYLHGTTLSYVLAPFVWLGRGDLDDLLLLRLVSVAAGVASVALTFLLAARIGGAAWVGIVAAFMLAFDATSVQWSAHVRMYALLQALTLAVILLSLRLLARPAGRWRMAAFATAFWLAIFTHVGAALLWPAMVLVAVVAHGRALLRERRDLLIGFGVCLPAPLAYASLNRVFRPENYREVSGATFFSFAGEGLFNLERFQAPVPVAWGELFGQGYANDFLPYIVVALSGLLVGRVFLGRRRRWHRVSGETAGERERRLALGALIAILVVSVLGVSAFTLDQEPRYLLHVHPIDYVLVAVGLATLAREIALPPAAHLLRSWRRWLPLTATTVLAAVVAFGVVADGLAVRFRTPILNADQIAALRYVEAHRRPGELVITYLTPAPYLAFGDAENVAFLAGARDTIRVARYTRVTAQGQTVDYWIGTDAITSTAELCQVLLARPDSWLIVDESRLRSPRAYGGLMALTILRLSELVWVGPGAIQVYRGWVPSASPATAAMACGGPSPGQYLEEPIALAPLPRGTG